MISRGVRVGQSVGSTKPPSHICTVGKADGANVTLTADLHPVPTLRMSGDRPLLPLHAFMAHWMQQWHNSVIAIWS
jgi:hypothetical protein